MDDLTTTQGIVALAAAGVAAVALILAVVLAFRLRRLRRAQTTVMGAYGAQDLIAHAAGLHEQFTLLRDYVDDLAARLDERMRTAETRLEGAISHRALVRYDAYGEMSGHQSTSIALLDAEGSGLVISSILHRDQARMYAKTVHEGQGELELSPEEADAVRIALEGGVPAKPPAR